MSITRRKLAGTLFAMLGPVLWVGAAHAAAPAGTVVALAGSSTAHSHPLKRGDVIQLNDAIDVPSDSNLKLQMTDGTVILVAPKSRLTLAGYSVGADGRRARFVLTQGLLRVVVTPVAGPQTFEVSTAAGTASVRSASADWFILADAGSSQVGVLAGTVDFISAATGQSVSIPAHWGTRLEAGRSPMLLRVWAQMEFNAVIRLTECCQSTEEAAPSGR
jgi:hypothetical protein